MKRKSTEQKWQQANEELDSRMVSAMSKKDVDGVMSCFADSPEVIAVLWGTEMRGPGELRQAVESLFRQYDSVKLSIDRISRIRTGDTVLGVGQATYSMRKGNDHSTLREVWTDVRCEVRGKWVYMLDHAEVLLGT
jgi:ketosteroid isomerase-like protein